MRTLKKALCLVLVLAMVFTLAVPAMAASAKDYKDYSEITNKEAVDVLTAIGVIHGDNGSFLPEGTFTRAQAATMISYLMLGSKIADALPAGGTQFSDVPANHWASKYVQYCANEGIIAGYGNGKFGPNDTLTASQWALMLLGALGYKASNESIGGAGWEIQVTKLAMQAGVASADELTGTFNRDMAAKMALNTLTADMVEYEGGSKVEINGATITSGAVRKDVQNTAKTETIKSDDVMQFAEQHFPQLKLTDAAGTTDAFDRPAAKWVNGVTSIGTYSKTPDLTYTTTVKASDLYKDLGLTATQTDGIVYKVDGKTSVTEKYDGGIGKTSTWTVGGNGTLTEVYKNVDENGAITGVTIIEVKTYFGQVSAVTKATSTVDRSVTVDGMKFTTEGFAMDDYVLYTKAETSTPGVYAIQSMKAATPAATGTVTYVNGTNKSFIVGGTTYKYSATNTDTATVGATATLYLDDYGYVIKDTGAKAVTNYAVVVDYVNDYASSIFGTKTDMAKLVLTDGSVVEVKADGDITGPSDVNVLVTYTVSNDVYTLTKVTSDNGITAVTTNKSTLKDGVYGDSKTVFIVRSGNGNIDNPFTYKVYTGIANVPSMTGVTATAAVKNFHADVVYVTAGTEVGVAASKATFVTEIGAQQITEYAADGKTKITYWLQNAVVDGEVTTIKSSNKLNGVYSATVSNANGIVTGATPAANVTPLTNATAVYVNGVIAINGGYMGFTSDAVCYIVDAKTGAIAEASFSGLSDKTTLYNGFYTVKDGIVTGVYLVPQV